MSSNVKNSGDFEQGSVNQESRRGFMSMLVVMLGFTFFSASMFAGGALGAGMSFSGFLWAVMAGNLILGAYCGTLAYIAARTGDSIHILARYSFGRRGSYLPSFLLGITQVGWFGVGVAMFSIPIQKWLIENNVEGAASNSTLWTITIIAGLLMTSTAYFGIKSLTILSYVAVPAIVVLGLYSAFRALGTDFPVAGAEGAVQSGWDTMLSYSPAPSAAIGATAAIAFSVGSFISGGSCTPDFVRFSKNAKIAVITTVIAFFLGNSLMFFFGAVGTMTYQVNDISEVLFKPWDSTSGPPTTTRSTPLAWASPTSPASRNASRFSSTASSEPWRRSGSTTTSRHTSTSSIPSSRQWAQSSSPTSSSAGLASTRTPPRPSSLTSTGPQSSHGRPAPASHSFRPASAPSTEWRSPQSSTSASAWL